MGLSADEVAKVALLARLRISPDELETFTGQLNSIVGFVAQLQELDTTASSRWPTGSRSATSSATTSAAVAAPRGGPGQRPQAQRRDFLVPAVLE